MTDCEKYEKIFERFFRMISDLMIRYKDYNLSDEDVQFMMRHLKTCMDSKHISIDWGKNPELATLHERATSSFLNELRDLDEQEHEEITKNSPHEWILNAMREVGAEFKNIADLIGRVFVFTYNLNETDDHIPEQCGIVSGTIVGVGVNSYTRGDAQLETIQLASSEARMCMMTVDGERIEKVVCVVRVSDALTKLSSPGRAWQLLFQDYCDFSNRHPITGTLRILPKK
jgi:hypothetical protein